MFFFLRKPLIGYTMNDLENKNSEVIEFEFKDKRYRCCKSVLKKFTILSIILSCCCIIILFTYAIDKFYNP